MVVQEKTLNTLLGPRKGNLFLYFWLAGCHSGLRTRTTNSKYEVTLYHQPRLIITYDYS